MNDDIAIFALADRILRGLATALGAITDQKIHANIETLDNFLGDHRAPLRTAYAQLESELHSLQSLVIAWNDHSAPRGNDSAEGIQIHRDVIAVTAADESGAAAEPILEQEPGAVCGLDRRHPPRDHGQPPLFEADGAISSTRGPSCVVHLRPNRKGAGSGRTELR